MTFKALSLICFIFTLVGCSSVKMKEEPKQYSRETVKSFEEVERQNALERYRQLRKNNWQETKKGKRRIRNTRPTRYYSPKKVVKPKKTIIPTNPENQKIEVQQILKFFCMEKRKDPRFNASNTCESYTENLLSKCEESYQWDDKKLTSCIKSRLK